MPRAAARTRASEGVLPGPPAALDDEQRLALALERLTAIELARVPELGFIAFCEGMLGVTLTSAQKALASVVYDGKAPEGPLVPTLFGGWKGEVPSGAEQTALIVCGRASGKTSVLCAARALHLALTVPLDRLAKTEAALVAVVAPDQRQSRHTLAFVKGYLKERPALAKALHYEETLDIVRVVRPDGHPVTIEARPATAGGKAVRGPSLAGVILDEAAFFYGDGFEVSDVEIYRAARPRLLPGAQIVLATTPWAQSGLVWEIFRDNFDSPKRAVVARAPTLLMRPGKETEELVRLEREADPDNASREFDAQFLSADAERFFPESLIERIVDPTLLYLKGAPIVEVVPGERVRFGADFAFDADCSALCGFVERTPEHAKVPMFICCELGEERPKADAPLVPGEVVAGFAKQVRRAGGKLVVADAHYRRSIETDLAAAELALVPSDGVPADGFLVTRALMAQGRVRIPPHPRLLAQLRRVRSVHKTGGQVSIVQPRARDGGHGDMVSALVCALSGVSLTATQPSPGPRNALEAEAQVVRRQRDEKMKRLEQEHDRGAERGFRRRFGIAARSAVRRLYGAAQGGGG
jgi:hypothetical protein